MSEPGHRPAEDELKRRDWVALAVVFLLGIPAALLGLALGQLEREP